MKYHIKSQITRCIPVFPLSEFLLPNTVSSLPLGLARRIRMSSSFKGPCQFWQRSPVHASPSHSDLMLGPTSKAAVSMVTGLSALEDLLQLSLIVSPLHGCSADLFPALILNETASAIPPHLNMRVLPSQLRFCSLCADSSLCAFLSTHICP